MPGNSGYAVGWGALALINAGLAQGKQRSGLVWFMVSLLLGPVATLFIVVMPVPGVETRPLQRTDRVVIAIVLVIFAALVVGLFAASSNLGITLA